MFNKFVSIYSLALLLSLCLAGCKDGNGGGTPDGKGQKDEKGQPIKPPKENEEGDNENGGNQPPRHEGDGQQGENPTEPEENPPETEEAAKNKPQFTAKAETAGNVVSITFTLLSGGPVTLNSTRYHGLYFEIIDDGCKRRELNDNEGCVAKLQRSSVRVTTSPVALPIELGYFTKVAGKNKTALFEADLEVAVEK